MGLVRKLLKLVPAVATFAAGYYIGTINSDEYECIFEDQGTRPAYEQQLPTQHDTIEQVIHYDL